MGNSHNFNSRDAIKRVKEAAMELRHAIRDAVEGPLDHTERLDLHRAALENLRAINGLVERNSEMLGAFVEAGIVFSQEEQR